MKNDYNTQEIKKLSAQKDIENSKLRLLLDEQTTLSSLVISKDVELEKATSKLNFIDKNNPFYTNTLLDNIKVSRLEIKIAIFKDAEGNPLSGAEIITKGIADQTFGIFHDEEGNSISFNGTIKNNVDTDEIFYDFNVHKNWIEGQKEFVKNNYSKFLELWDVSELQDFPDEENKNVDIID